MSYNSDLEQIRKRAEGQGWRYRRTEGGHHQFYSPDKETIVTAAGTPGDQRGWLNFLADMKRGGYKDDYGTLTKDVAVGAIGLAMLEAKGGDILDIPLPAVVSKPTEEVEEHVVSVAEHVRSILKNNPTKAFHMSALLEKIKPVNKKANFVSINQTCIMGVKTGIMERVEKGTYKWAGKDETNVRKTTPRNRPVKAARPSATDDDKFFDLDLKQLDEALAALGRIEEVVRRTKERLAKLAEVRKFLGG